VELPFDGEWQFTHVTGIEGRLSTGMFVPLDLSEPSVMFSVIAMDAGGAAYAGVDIECEPRITAAAAEDGLEASEARDTGIAGHEGKVARAEQTPSGVESATRRAYVCVIIDGTLYLLEAWVTPSSAEFDLLSMLYSFEVEV
jgi:hypothetical protein